MLLVLASMIAFMGLIENSTVVLVASMLVSPIMGPILAGIFGSVVGDDKWDIFMNSGGPGGFYTGNIVRLCRFDF